MKTNFLRIAMLFAVSIALLTSCSNDDDPAPIASPSFFNLKVGNKWVYKKYYHNPINGYSYTGTIDSVEVIGITPINGFNYSEIRHKRTNDPYPQFEYLRVDAAGHLLGYPQYTEPAPGATPYIFHPGLDATYETDVTENYGTIHYFLAPAVIITVEGNQYTISPYKGDFTPTGSATVTKTIEYDYQPQVGLVKQIIHPVAGEDFWEERLVSYQLN